MRAYTLVVSVLAHAIAVIALVIAPLLATTELPEPHLPSAFVVPRPVTVMAPDMPRRSTTAAANPSPVVAPVTAPPSIAPEGIVEEPRDLSIGGGLSSAPSLWQGGIIDGGDPLPLPPVRSAPQGRMRAGVGVQAPVKLVHVPPVYPAIAREAGVQGTVILEAVISASGQVEDVKVLRSARLLDASAIEAVRQWRFTPTMFNGQAIPVVMTVTVTFTLTNGRER